MKVRGVLAALGLTYGLMAGQVAAQSIGVNLASDGRGPASAADCTLAPTDVAGVVPQANWINLTHNQSTGFDGVASNLNDSAATATSVQFEWISNDAYSTAASSTTPDERLMRGIQKARPGSVTFPAPNSAMTFRWGNLLPGSTYNVIVYQVHNGGTAKSISTVTGFPTTYYLQQEIAYDGTFDRSAVTNFPADAGAWAATEADYVQFDGVSPDTNGVIEIVVDKFLEDPALADGIGVSGIQLVKLTGDWPAPTTPPQITQQPQDVLGVVSNDVTITIGIDGPWVVEWFKNGNPVASGADTFYTFASTAADKDASVYAVVSNEVGTVTSEVAVVTLDDPQPAQFIQGFLRGEFYGGKSGYTTVFPDVYNDPDFQARNFDSEFFVVGGDGIATGLDDFFRVIEGYVVPPESGSWRFFISSDDGSELFVNPAGGPAGALPAIPSPSAAVLPDAQELAFSAPNQFEEPIAQETTDPFLLSTGTFYGVAAIHKEGGQNDHFQLAWREQTDSTPAAELTPLSPVHVSCWASPAGKRAELTTQPQSIGVLGGQTATFEVGAATLPEPDQYGVQWTRDGVDIPGADAPVYTTEPLTVADDGAVYRARVFTLLGEFLSDPATLSVTLDITGPTLVSAGTYPGTNLVGIVFDEAVDPVTAADPLNYSLSGATVVSADPSLLADDVVLLTLDVPPTPGGSVQATGVLDLSGNPSSTTATLETSALDPQTMVASPTDPLNPGRSAFLGGGDYYLEAGGSDFWRGQDAGYIVTTPWTGAFDLQVRVEALTGPNNFTKMGLVVRETTNTGSRAIALFATRTEGLNLYEFQWRGVTDGGSDNLDDATRLLYGPPNYPDAWLRLVRPDPTGNVFQAYVITNGVDWVLYGEYTVPGDPMAETLLVGMGGTSHNNNAGAEPARALCREFSIETPVVVTPPVIDSLVREGTTLRIQWSSGGELETAPAADTPSESWIPTGDSSGDYTEPLGPGGQKYYRLRN